MKKVIWLYFFLLIFEGALRKWFFPSLSTPLLIVRDPIAVLALAFAYHKGYFPRNAYLSVFMLVGFISFFTAIILGHGNLLIAIYGLRIFIIHLPFMFLIGKIFDQSDVIKIGDIMLWIAIPMTVLITLQFYSPQSAWVNRGVGGDVGGAGFSGALGYFRPPGTFSFTNGNSLFYGMLTPFVLFFWLQQKQKISLWLLLIVSACLLAAIPLSISRTLLFQFMLSLSFSLFILIKRPQAAKSIFIAFICLMALVVLLRNLPLFQTSLEAFTVRFESANRAEGGVEGVFVDRFLGGMFGAILGENQTPLFGYGLGLGTNVGSQISTGGLTFVISEGEWGRLIGEMGFFLGMIIIIARILLVIKLGSKSYQRLANNDILPWLLFSFALLLVLQGQWSQPTSLGFVVFGGGLIIASFRTNKLETESEKRIFDKQ
ncbi:hypothetical protein [Parapedobacter koreensis]|uniref:hypothetical protein n=1 Tax=Parapedobacter koreensis TaxID=332977 RepID=UPI001C43400A|nr:hypothetical protein [Parapedobacter koreensis]